MAQYTRKNPVVEAILFTGENRNEVGEWLMKHFNGKGLSFDSFFNEFVSPTYFTIDGCPYYARRDHYFVITDNGQYIKQVRKHQFEHDYQEVINDKMFTNVNKS